MNWRPIGDENREVDVVENVQEKVEMKETYDKVFEEVKWVE